MRVPDASMGSEDFSYFLHEVPGCYFLVGASAAKEGEVSIRYPAPGPPMTLHARACR